ncbi:MAG: hypothetical protein K6T65_16945 [Peptococcaceae bacterium]|nr:hypothetical protein [Peptococcaceae bacterium]
MATLSERYFNSKRKNFSLKEIKEAQEKLNMEQRGKDEEYNEVLCKEYVELLPYRERANKCRR